MRSIEDVCYHIAANRFSEYMNGGSGICPDIRGLAYAYNLSTFDLRELIEDEYQLLLTGRKKKGYFDE